MTTANSTYSGPELHSLDTNSFEQLVNSLAIRVLGNGHTSFGPGRDGGRDGYFEGAANYPSEADRWSGIWYIQSKFHAPHLSTNPQKWLLAQIESELKAFEQDEDRVYPDIWIIATNIDPSGVPETGSFDKAKELVAKYKPGLEKRFHIWGGKKIIDLLISHPNVAEQYGHFLTPGNVLTALYKNLENERVAISDIIRYLVIREFEANQYTKLDQAGSQSDTRPGVHELFVDLPLRSDRHQYEGHVLADLLKTSSRNHRPSLNQSLQGWDRWEQHPTRARVWFILGGPGQGKSTTGQYFSQLQRASLILGWDGDPIKPHLRDTASSIKKAADQRQHWPNTARIPVTIELREYAKWHSDQDKSSPLGVLSYLATRVQKYLQRPVQTSAFKMALREQSWFFAFDGLDEVPSDVKTDISNEVVEFIDDLAYECDCDALFVCTTRPQGYAGQLDQLTSMRGQLSELGKEKALECAKPVISIGRSPEEIEKGFGILVSAIESSSVASLMKTPLQSHIMAVVVRDGRRPPERRWALFENFYQVIKSREANRDLPDVRLARLLREENKLLKAIHNKIGFTLHAAAERSQGAQTSISRQQFREIAESVVEAMKSEDKPGMVNILEQATETRLVLVNTPDDGESLRYDIRQLQEFFAAEYFYDTVTTEQFRERIAIAGGDAHWREVMHFLFSAMIELARVSEIHEIVILLQHLDSGGTDVAIRDLRRRLAIGASLAARLLQDGVLEQDKRIRTRFEISFESLLSTNEVSLLYPLYSIPHPESRSWLCGLCIKRLEEAVPAESVGAALILLGNMTLEDPQSQYILDLFRQKPIDFRREVLSGAQTTIRGDNLGDFHLKFVFEELLSEDWYDLPISILADFYGAGDTTIKKVCSALNISEVERDLLNILLFERHSPDEKEIVEQVGNVALVSYKMPKLAAIWESKLDRSIFLVPATGRGFLSFVVAIARFNFHMGEAELISLVEQMEAAPLKIWDNIPHGLRRFLPKCIVDFILAGKTGRISKLLSDIQTMEPSVRGVRFTNDVSRSEIDIQSFDRLCILYPSAASIVYFEQDNRSLTEGWGTEFADRMLEAFEADITLVRRIGMLQWGFLANHVSKHNSLRAVELLGKAYTSVDTKFHRWRRIRIEASPFAINLDRHIHLVYHLLLEVFHCYSFSGVGVHRRHSRKPLDHNECRDEIVRIIGGFVDLDVLSSIRLEDATNIDRGVINVILLLLRKVETNSLFGDLYDVLEKTRDCGFLSIVIGLLGLAGGTPCRDSQLFVSRILHLFRDSYEHRDEISVILSTWREGSIFPVFESNPTIWEYS